MIRSNVILPPSGSRPPGVPAPAGVEPRPPSGAGQTEPADLQRSCARLTAAPAQPPVRAGATGGPPHLAAVPDGDQQEDLRAGHAEARHLPGRGHHGAAVDQVLWVSRRISCEAEIPYLICGI